MSTSILRFWFSPLLVLGLAWPQGPSEEVLVPPNPADSGPGVVPQRQPTALTVDDLLEHPAEHVGQSVVLTVQMHSKVGSWNPLLTRFGDGQYSAWDAWSDSQFPWRETDFRAPAIRVFATHDSAAEWALADAEPLDRYSLTCKVQSVLGGRPWLEVEAVKPLVRQLGEGAVIHASRGLDQMNKQLWKGAIEEFERALAGGLHETARLELDRLIEVCRTKVPVEIYQRVER